MSASLVGSEMCIRDRGPPSRGRRAAGSRPGTRGLRDARGGWPGRGRSACLLYTSDAADDM
eukprot:14737972-Alexandrium_andersonii.AAC.1